jgi:hypothetical protein
MPDGTVPDYETIASWCKRTGMSQANVYVKLQAGELLAIKIGTRTHIDVKHGLAWLAAQPRWQPSAPVQASPRHKGQPATATA